MAGACRTKDKNPPGPQGSAGFRFSNRNSLAERPLIVVQDRAEAAVLGEQRIATVAEQVQVEGLVGLPLAVAVDFDRDGLRRLAGGEGQRAGLDDVVAINTSPAVPVGRAPREGGPP